MSEPSSFHRFLDALRSRRGRKFLVLCLVAAVGAVLWWYVGRMPAEGTVEVRWTEDPPQWISISYTDEAGATVRWRREAVVPGVDRFRDGYKLAPGTYWVRIEYKRADHLRTVRQRVELPTSQPYVLVLDELEAPR